LTRDMLLYAAGDVLILINEQLYLNMSKWVYFVLVDLISTN
jgi:hypothetical protein